MARQVLPIVGAAVGAYFGGPAGAQLGYAIGSLVGNAVDPLVVSGPKIGEAGLQTSAEGVYRPIVYGTAALKGNIICRGNRVVRKHREQQGKGGPVTETERVYWTYAIRLTGHQIEAILRIWEDEKLVYDVRPGSTIQAESEDFAGRFRFYNGSETQLPDPDLEAFLGIGNTPAFRGTSYIVFPNYDLTDTRERIREYRVEVATASTQGVSGKWIFGPVTQNGASGGPMNYYRVTDDPLNWSSGSQIQTPSWLSIIGRISTTNGACFMASGVGGANSAVSFDRGLTWQECDAELSSDDNVFWNGDFYYCLDIRSSNGINWETIPNLSGTPDETMARTSDGMIVCTYSAGGTRFEFSTTNGVNWTVVDLGGAQCEYLTSDGSRFLFTSGGTLGRYTDDINGPYFISTVSDFSAQYAPYYGDGIWLRKGFNGRILRSIDGGESFDVQAHGRNYGAVSDHTIDFSQETGEWAAASVVAGSPDEWTIEVSQDGGSTWEESDILYGTGGNIAFIGGSGSSAGSAVPLTDIVADMHLRAGHALTDFDTNALTGIMVDGLVLADAYTCADVIRTLAGVYFFDGPEYDNGSGYCVRYVMRGGPVVATITENDLIDAPEKTVREDSLERPKALHLSYQSPLVGYAPAKATVTRDSPDIRVVGEVTIQVPVCFLDVSEPRQIAHKLHKVAWAQVAGEEEFTLSDRWLELIPSDPIGLAIRGQVRRVMITQEMIEAGCQPYRMLADRQSAYTSTITGIPLPEPTPPPPSLAGETIFDILDIPALNDNNDRLLMYAAATGQTEAWYGALVQRAVLPDVTWQDATTFNQNTVMGVLLSTINAASEYYTDTTNRIHVQLFGQEVIDSLTQQQFLSEGGSFAIERLDGSWEVGQYRDADENMDGSYTLSYLARGRLNTGATAHVVGSRFVLLDGVRSIDAVTAWIGNQLMHRAVSFGTSPDGVDTETMTYTGKSQIEFPVAHLFLSRDADTINAMAVPRHRFGTEVTPVRSINWAGYSWTATDGVNSITNETLTDTTSFNVSGWASPVTVSVSQRNRFTGPGPSVSESVQ